MIGIFTFSRTAFVWADGVAEVEHPADGNLMAIADNVMNGPALFRGEVDRIGIFQVQGRNQVEQPLQRRWAGLLKIGRLTGVPLDQFLHRTLVHSSLVGPEGDDLAILECGGGDLGVEQGRNPEFPGHGSQVAGGAADIGDDSSNLVDQRGESCGSATGHEDGIRFNRRRGVPPYR